MYLISKITYNTSNFVIYEYNAKNPVIYENYNFLTGFDDNMLKLVYATEE